MSAQLPEEFTCKQLVELVTDWLEGRLSAGDRERFEQHLAHCKGCAAYVEQIRQTIAAAGAAKEPPDARAQDELVRLFRGWKKK